MKQADTEERQRKITASKIMVAANFDPQSGCTRAFRYVVEQVNSLSKDDDLQAASEEIAEYLTEEFKGIRGDARPVNVTQIHKELNSLFSEPKI